MLLMNECVILRVMSHIVY